MEYVTKLWAMSTASNRPLVYLDETGFNLHVKKSKGRSVKGEPATISLVPKGKRVTVIAALTQSGIVHHRLVQSGGSKKRGTNSDDFSLFLRDMMPVIPRNSIVIMDNCKIHHKESLDSQWVQAKATYGIDRLFLSPYSPFLNPIEYAFNDLKMAVKNKTFMNQDELVQVIQECIPTIDGEKAKGYFKQSEKYYRQVMLGLAFTGKPLNPEIPIPDDQLRTEEIVVEPSVPLLTQA
jgi:transposase